MNISGSLSEIIKELEHLVTHYPRRRPGRLIWDDVPLHYVDLHSFYYQARQIFIEELYRFDAPQKPLRIIDCGAHIGLATLYFNQQYPTARITAFEADPEIYACLEKNIVLRGLDASIASDKAVWVENGSVPFNCSSDDSGTIGQTGKIIPAIRLHDVIEQEEKIDLLKMDIEGAEYDVILDCLPVLGRVEHLVVEAHVLENPSITPMRLGKMLSVIEQSGFKYVLGDLHQATWIKDAKGSPFKSISTDRFICTVFAWRD